MGWTGIPIIGNIIDKVGDYFIEGKKQDGLKIENEKVIIEQNHELNIKKLDVATELAKQGIQVEASWDARAQQDMKYSWKDEWFVILFSIPLIMAFIPSMQPYVLEGFKTLDQTPEWYMLLVSGIVCATFGLRWYMNRVKL